MAKLLHYVINVFSDTLLSDDYVPIGVQMTNAPALWARGCTGKNVVVAVIDSGADYNHPDFRNRFLPPINLSSSSTDRDENGHGTHVTGTIAANGWLRGVAPDCRILPIKVFDAGGSAPDSAIIKAFRVAADWTGPSGERVNVINASFGGAVDTPELHASVRYAISKGIIVPTAAGNGGCGDPSKREYMYPGAYDEVVEVASVNVHGAHSEFSNTNEEIDVCCLGEAVQSTYPTYKGHRYAVLSGTSMATPHEAGICAVAYEMFTTANGRPPVSEDEFWRFVAKNVKPLAIPKQEQGLGLGFLRPELLAPQPLQPEQTATTGGAGPSGGLSGGIASEQAPARGLIHLPVSSYTVHLRSVRPDAYIIQVGRVCRQRREAVALADAIRRRLELAHARVRRVGF